LPMPLIAQIIKPNVQFKGGIIHVIDRVLQFPTSLSKSALSANQTKFVSALNRSGILDTVDKEASITVFLPTDEGLATIDWANAEKENENKTKGQETVNGSASTSIHLQIH